VPGLSRCQSPNASLPWSDWAIAVPVRAASSDIAVAAAGIEAFCMFSSLVSAHAVHDYSLETFMLITLP
jgi:hypothetical protein